MEQQPTNPGFSSYIYILYKWRKLLLINLLLISIIAVIYAFTLPLKFKATAVIMIPPDNSLGLGGITSLLGSRGSAMSMGAKLLGVSNTSEDVLLGILSSRSALKNVITKFDLMNYYEIDDNNIDKTISAFSGDLSISPNEYGMIEISVINKDARMSAKIANYLVEIVDSINIELSVEQARNSKQFIEKRYVQNMSDLRAVEDSMFMFQKKYGIFAVPEQLEVAVKAAAEIESQLVSKEVAAQFIKEQYGPLAPQYNALMAEVNMLKSKVLELKEADRLTSVSNVLFPFAEVPEMNLKYYRLYREIEIQQAILEFVMPIYEQAKIEEQKSIPTIAVLDNAESPQMKDSPKRAFIIILILFIALILHFIIIFYAEKAITRNIHNNILEKKEHNFFTRIAKVYRLKF